MCKNLRLVSDGKCVKNVQYSKQKPKICSLSSVDSHLAKKKLLDPSDPAEELALISDSVSRMSPSENNISKLTHPDPRSSPFIGF